ncbi:Hypothetical predicted protein [Octopus vulgaris]|uniref:Alpha-carbonic anhydrase domain-containing protein n=1 Tax=Octopus vulgaris TaxID=6645 RepID=A0AA36FD93_OCTVU|nr:Hypothetical predicted protein [Octopus vulgaris]
MAAKQNNVDFEHIWSIALKNNPVQEAANQRDGNNPDNRHRDLQVQADDAAVNHTEDHVKKDIATTDTSEQPSEKEMSKFIQVKAIFKTPYLRKITIAISICWFGHKISLIFSKTFTAILTFSAGLLMLLAESKYWVKQYPDCGGKLQSPVAIEHKLTSYKESKDLLFEGYVDIMHNVTLKNIGHTVAIEVKSEGIVSGGELDGRYIAHQVHFHWGMNDIVGSEHMLNGKRYPMETSNTYEDNEGFADIVENVKMINFKGGGSDSSAYSMTAAVSHRMFS